MATLIPVIRARMGNRIYFIGKMRAREICQQVGIAAELENWGDLTIEELYQRELNRRRVEQEIGPYLVSTADRFFGSIIVLVNDPESIEFEPVAAFGAKLAASYQHAATDLGFLTVGAGQHSSATGGLVALDGQHRLAALRLTVQGGSVRGPHSESVADDEVTAIFVMNSGESESRRLFTTLNRSARRVSRSDLLLMNEDDGRSIVARRLVATPLLAPRGIEDEPLVKWSANTISNSDTAITTLNALNDAVEIIGDALDLPFVRKNEFTVRPSDDQLSELEVTAQRWLQAIFAAFPILDELRYAPSRVPDERNDSQPISTILKPAGFVTLFRAMSSCLDPGKTPLREPEKAAKALAGLDWRLAAPHWRGVLMQPNGRISGRKSDWNLAGDMMAVLAAGESTREIFREETTERYRTHMGDQSLQLQDLK